MLNLNWVGRVRRRWFPTQAERFRDGYAFAAECLGPAPTEYEVDMFFQDIRPGDAFDNGILDYCRKVNWGTAA